MINETDVFLNEDDFAESFIVTPPAGKAKTIKGFYYPENSPTQTGSVSVINDAPVVEFATTDSLTLLRKSAVKRVSTKETFYVMDPGVDVNGFTRKTLSRIIPQ